MSQSLKERTPLTPGARSKRAFISTNVPSISKEIAVGKDCLSTEGKVEKW